jgi:hypothetical protein
MEVHHHGHHDHGKKTWKTYFWEFFMLFLAVFCGSLAELQVEHYIEHQREKRYAQTLFEDLVNDTIDLHNDIEFWSRMIRKADSLRIEIEKPEYARNQALIYRLVPNMNTNNTFLYHDRTIQQLKSSGNFRLIRKKDIADSIVNYDAWIQKTINDIENIYGRVVSPQLDQLANRLFNSGFYKFRNSKAKLDSIQQKDPGALRIPAGKDDVLFEYYNTLNSYKGLAQSRVRFLYYQLQSGINLIAMIKKEYSVTPIEK